MNIIDIIIIIPLIWFAFRGLKNGLIKELSGLIAISTGIILSIKFADGLAEILESYEVTESEFVPLIAFAIIFISVIILTFMLSEIVNKFVKIIKLDWLNKIGGAIIGLIKTAIVLSGIMFLIDEIILLLSSNSLQVLNDSVLYNYISQIIHHLFPYIKTLSSFASAT